MHYNLNTLDLLYAKPEDVCSRGKFRVVIPLFYCLIFYFRRGEACSHIAAILFALEDYIAKGLNQLPDDSTCTDRLCEWNVPSKQNVEPETIHAIRIVRYKQLTDIDCL